MPIFTQSLRNISAANPSEAIKDMANHIRYIQEQLEYTLMNLDSGNIISIDTDDTELSGSAMEQIASLTQAVNSLASSVSTFSTNLAGVQQDVNSLASSVSTQSGNLAGVQQAVNGLSASVQNLENTKLTANKVAAQTSVADTADAAAIAAALNSLIVAMKSSGVMNT